MTSPTPTYPRTGPFLTWSVPSEAEAVLPVPSAEAERIELPSPGLEAGALPLSYTPSWAEPPGLSVPPGGISTLLIAMPALRSQHSS